MLNRKITSILLIAAFVFGGGLSLSQKVIAAADSTLYIDPASSSQNVGDDFTVDVVVNPGSHQVSNVDLYLTYDQTKIRMDSITPSASFSQTLAAASIPGDGTASISAGTAFGSNVTTNTIFATLHLHALSAVTNSSIAITSSSAVYADDEPGVNELGTRTPGTVTISVVVDSTPPTISGGTPSGILASGTTQVTVAVNTNESASCKYSATSGTAYGLMLNTFTTTGGTTHSFIPSGLTNGGSYAYYVRCQDGSGNPNTSDYTISFGIATPPTVSSSHHHSSSHSSNKKKTSKYSISNSKSKIARGATLIQRGKKFSSSSPVLLYFSKNGGGYYAPQRIMTSSSGAFAISYRVTKPVGSYSWYAVDSKTGKRSKTKVYMVK